MKKNIFILSLIIFLFINCRSNKIKNLSFWNMPFVSQEVSKSYVEKWQTDLNKKLTHIHVENFYGPGAYKDQRDKFLLQAKSSKPDIIEGLLEDAAVYVSKDLIYPLDDLFNNWDQKDQFIKNTLLPLTINGKLYGLPYNTNARALIYRKDILKEYNLTVPQTWPELIMTARKITKSTNKKIYGFFVCTEIGEPRSIQEFITWYYQVSGKQNMFDIIDGEIKFNGNISTFKNVLKLYEELFSGEFSACDPDQRGMGWQNEDDGYITGKWAMLPTGPWLWGRREHSDLAKDILENKTDISRMPYYEYGVPATYLEVKAIMMNSNTKNKNESWELIKYIVSKEKMAEWLVDSGGIPARKDSAEMDEFKKARMDWWIKGFANELPTSVAMAPINWGHINKACLEAVHFVIYNKKKPDEAAGWLNNKILTIIKNNDL